MPSLYGTHRSRKRASYHKNVSSCPKDYLTQKSPWTPAARPSVPHCLPADQPPWHTGNLSDFQNAPRLTRKWPARHSLARYFESAGHNAAGCQLKARPLPLPTTQPAAESIRPAGPPPAALPAGEATQADFLFELGMTHAAIGNRTAAIDAFRRATKLSPDMAPAWRFLGDLLQQAGDHAGANAAYAAQAGGNARRRAPVPPTEAQLKSADRYWSRRLQTLPKETAETVLRGVLCDTTPTDVVAMRRLAELSKDEAQRDRLLHRAVNLAPDYIAARRDYAMQLVMLNRHADALPQFQYLLGREPDNDMCRAFLALCYGHIGNYEKAIELYQASGSAFEAQPEFLLFYANALKYAGRRDDSVTILRICLQADAGDGLAWWTLANVKSEPFSTEDIRTMQAQLADGTTSNRNRYHIHYALGHALEQAGDYAESFAHYSQGAALKHAELNYDDSDFPNMARRMKAFFTPARFAAAKGTGCPDPAPIFIVGLPRSGSTLVEQILASHSQVEGTMELPAISAIVRDIGVTQKGFRYPEILGDMDAAALAALGQRYIERTRIYRKTDRPFYIDKTPSNWAHVGLIQLILPNAKIIDARRHPMATCFAAFKQLFGSAVNYSYDLGDIGRYYNIYLDRMAWWNNVLPGRVHRVLYENMVEDTEGQVRRLLEYCGLPFEDACLRFWENKRAVATPSAEQVRRPIFREGLDQWRRYEPFLGKLKQALDAPGVPRWDA